MSSHLEDAKNILANAKVVYHRALRQVDSKLRAAVSQDPANLPAANEIIENYASGYVSQELSPNVQPGDLYVEIVTDPSEIEKALADLEPEPKPKAVAKKKAGAA